MKQPTFPEPNANDAAALSKTGLPVPITVSSMQEELFVTPHLYEIHSIVYDEYQNGMSFFIFIINDHFFIVLFVFVF